ncbi:hypothetical protein VSS74_11935 [Conexibacter stalactiti]|uniref:Peptidase inhibitor family I36 n=1 Tax=Conexibacter stalactiti TaxID=1940611 RepID=A0ABU4HSL7_9ACTN|nr:hypothetical protein [Conexibacter stalactiti]MDW5595054.1 hypothetical protein [Conexibacter stalactiti]MEC5035696.1 hypothetical protein [Conexibacter stalactiti]
MHEKEIDPPMTSHVKRRSGIRRKALAILAGTAVATMTSGAAADSASAYSCVPYGSANLCTYYDAWTVPSTLRFGTWHSLQWSIGQNNQAPGNRTVYADIADGPCGCVRRSQQANGYAAVQGIQDNTFTYWNSGQPRSMLTYVEGGLLGQQIY